MKKRKNAFWGTGQKAYIVSTKWLKRNFRLAEVINVTEMLGERPVVKIAAANATDIPHFWVL